MRVPLATFLFLTTSPALARSSDNYGGLIFLGLIGCIVTFFFIQGRINSGIEAGIRKRKAELDEEAARQQANIAKVAEEERCKTQLHADGVLRQLNQKMSEVEAAKKAFEVSFIHGRKWLAEYIAEAFAASDYAIAQELENKKRPAQKAADEIRRISAEKKALCVRLKYLEYAIKTYHEYYPVLEEYSDDILNELASLELEEEEEDDAPDADRVARYISKEEYTKLSVSQRNQLALDKWRVRRKSNVEIGRSYERYLGYLYEKDGWTVTFIGALEGLEDMGRDLLCILEDKVQVVQAKYWAKHKTIHEKHIFQLYGTTILLPRTHPELKEKQITSIFAATTGLSDTAKWAAQALDVGIRLLNMDQDYPVIKCNINGDNRIYHLPFDQQYDRVRIIPSQGELYVKTVKEAEAKGFRRAKRHYGG